MGFVGADIIRPVVSPMGKQRRRNAPTMQCQTFANEIRWYNVETWHICNIGTPIRPIRCCSKICRVGGRMISAPTWRVPSNYRSKILIAHKLRIMYDAVHPCRGGYHPPGCFPPWGKQRRRKSADNAPPNICKRNSVVSCRNTVLFNIGTRYGQFGSAQKFATLAGG